MYTFFKTFLVRGISLKYLLILGDSKYSIISLPLYDSLIGNTCSKRVLYKRNSTSERGISRSMWNLVNKYSPNYVSWAGYNTRVLLLRLVILWSSVQRIFAPSTFAYTTRNPPFISSPSQSAAYISKAAKLSYMVLLSTGFIFI